MKRYETTRRSFLGSLAVLAAGAAVSSPVRLFSGQPVPTGLQQQWDLFCRRHEGSTFYGSYPNGDEYMLPEVAGHTYKSGKAICFREAGLLALPVWIYWGTDKPADVCITLFEKATGPWKKIRRLNNYELQGLNALSAEVGGMELLAALKESAIKPGRSGKLSLTARIKKDKAQIKAVLSQSQVTLEEKLISYYG